MKNILILIAMLMMPLVSLANLNVFTCEPEWQALAQELGGKHVEASSATNALQDPHYIQARPGLISKVRRADLLICSGSQLEIGWLPMLLRKANNPAVMPGSTGYIEASQHVRRLGASGGTDRAQGDVHPQGNPHVQTNPHNILLIAKVVAARMAELDPENAPDYDSNLQDFSQRWQTAIVKWEKLAQPLRGKPVIVHHKSWVYLEDWLGFEEVATLEPVSGVPPTASHLASLLQRFSDRQAAAFIIRAPFQNGKASEWLSERTGIPAVLLPLTVGGTPEASDLFSWFDDILNRLLNAETS